MKMHMDMDKDTDQGIVDHGQVHGNADEDIETWTRTLKMDEDLATWSRTWKHRRGQEMGNGKWKPRRFFFIRICSSCKWKFVVYLFVEEETNGIYPF